MREPGQVAPDNEAGDVQLWQRWRQGERPEVGEFLAGFPDLGGTEVVAVLLVDEGVSKVTANVLRRCLR